MFVYTMRRLLSNDEEGDDDRRTSIGASYLNRASQIDLKRQAIRDRSRRANSSVGRNGTSGTHIKLRFDGQA